MIIKESPEERTLSFHFLPSSLSLLSTSPSMATNGVASWRMRSESMDLSRPDSTEAHVLAVDDSLLDRKVIERLLKISSCKVTAVDSGVRALEFLGLDEQKSPANFDSLKVDLIITDYCMPGMNGYELLKKIKESAVLRQIPVVIMSSENVMARIDRCLEEGAEDFIVKPVKLSDVKRLKDFMSRDSRVKAAPTTTAAAAVTDGDKESHNNHKRKLRESSDDQFSSPASTSPSSSPPLSPSPESQSMSSPSQSAASSLSSSPPSSAPDSPSSLESPTRRLRLTNSY